MIAVWLLLSVNGQVVDVGITFQERVAGESKLTMKQNVQYLQQLISLYWDRYAAIIVVLVFALLAIFYQLFLMLV